MPGWQGSTRRSSLPSNWPELRRLVLERDGHRCVERFSDGTRCPDKATEVDHVRRGNDHGLSNLRSLCEWHHQQKSSREGAAALDKRRQDISQRFRRHSDRHPFLS